MMQQMEDEDMDTESWTHNTTNDTNKNDTTFEKKDLGNMFCIECNHPSFYPAHTSSLNQTPSRSTVKRHKKSYQHCINVSDTTSNNPSNTESSHSSFDVEMATFSHHRHIIHDKPTYCRSVLHVNGICCASEVPTVTQILRNLSKNASSPVSSISSPIRGISINILSKLVYVEHDPYHISVYDMIQCLNHEGFHATVRTNGAPTKAVLDSPSDHARDKPTPHLPNIETSNEKDGSITEIDIHSKQNHDSLHDDVAKFPCSTMQKSRFVESTILLPPMTMTSHVHALESILTQFKHNRNSKTHEMEILDFHIHLPSRSFKVDHDPLFISASSIVEALTHASHQKQSDESHEMIYTNKTFFTFSSSSSPSLPDLDFLSKIILHVDGAVERLYLPIESLDEADIDSNEGHYKKIQSQEDDLIRSATVDQCTKHTEKNHKMNRNKFLSYLSLTTATGLQLNVILSGFFWILSMVGALLPQVYYLKYFGLLSVLFGLPPVAMKAYRTFQRRHFDANCMMVIAALGALALGEYDEAASVSFLFAISEYLESLATCKARKALEAIVNLQPDHAYLFDPITNSTTIVSAKSLPVGCVVCVRTGDMIPTDGIIIEGSSQVDESSLTGEAKPIDKTIGDLVCGGSTNLGLTRLLIRTSSLADDSTLSRLIRLVEDAQSNQSPTEKLVDSFARAYTPLIICLAFMMCTVPWIMGHEIGRHWTLNGLIMIVISCPCALTISTPVTYSAGLAAAARCGVVIKNGAHMEAIGQVKTVVMDKTGTLTKGKFTLTKMEQIQHGLHSSEVLELLATMESYSSHPLASSLVNAAKASNIDVPSNVNVVNHTTLEGEGITATVDGRAVYVGNTRLFNRLGMYSNIDEKFKLLAHEWDSTGGTVGFLGLEDMGIVAMFCVTDVVREEAIDVITVLQRMGISVAMLSGDADGASRVVAKQAGIPDSNVHSGCLPADKLNFIKALKHSNSSLRSISCWARNDLVLMLGDGVNDAPALSLADVGVSMGGGASLAIETSDVILLDSNLSHLLFTIKIGKKTIITIRENIGLSLFSKIFVIVLTFLGHMTLLWAIVSDVGIMLLVTLNGMKLLWMKPKAQSERRKRSKPSYERLTQSCEEIV